MKNFKLQAVLFLIISAHCAGASVQVLPDGQGARPLQPKTLELKAQIAGGFAATTETWTFANTAANRIEAEFIAEAPPDAVVTSFAYWFGGEKVVARIVEKARAAEIYRGVVGQRRDPALVEMLQRNFFRARISPVEAKADLRVEVTWVQPLVFKSSALIYEVPLRRDGESLSLESWKTTIQIAAGAPLGSVENNFGATIEKSAASFVARASGAKTPPESLQISLKPTAGQTWPALATTSPSASTAYFAVLQAARPSKAAKGVMPVRQAVLKAGDGTLIIGRGALPPGVVRRDVAGVAEKLWAARRIDELERDVKQREEVMRLSVRYGLPSRWTSWLAIPTAERARLKPIIERQKREQAQLNLNALGRQMALEVATGGDKTRGYALMKAQFEMNSRILERPSGPALQEYFARQLSDTASALHGRSDGHWSDDPRKNLVTARSLYLQVTRLARRVPPQDRPAWISDVERQARLNVAGAQAVYQADRLTRAIVSGKSAPSRHAIEKQMATGLGREALAQSLHRVADSLAKEWAEAKAAPRYDARRVAALKKQTERIIARRNAIPAGEKINAQKFFAAAEKHQFFNPLWNLNTFLAAEIAAKREHGPRAQELRAQLRALKQRLQYPVKDTLSFQPYIAKIVGQLRAQQVSAQPDAAQIAALQAELARLKTYADPKEFGYDVHRGNEEWRRQARTTLAQQWAEARYGEQSDPQAVEHYARQLQKILDEDYEARKKSWPGTSEKRQEAMTYLQNAESNWLGQQSGTLIEQIIAEEGALRPDETKIAQLRAQLNALQSRTLYNTAQNDQWIEGRQWAVFNSVLESLRAERQKPALDKALIVDLEKRVVALQPFDYYYRSWPNGGRRPQDPQEFGKLRVERIAVRAEREKVVAQLRKTPADTSLRQEEVRLASRENALTVRMGDPLIAVLAPANCRQVIAILPWGEIKKLLFNVHAKQWEARFDVPAYAVEGSYKIPILIVTQDGKRHQLDMNLRVDLQTPRGVGLVQVEDSTWLLRLQTDTGTDRVEVLLPWGARLDLRRATGSAFAGRVVAPAAFQQQNARVTFVLTSLAHNRTDIVVDVAPPVGGP